MLAKLLVFLFLIINLAYGQITKDPRCFEKCGEGESCMKMWDGSYLCQDDPLLPGPHHLLEKLVKPPSGVKEDARRR
ncbi:unnamed protein product, partial [Mesorhabditis spiculigera]